MLRVSVPAFLVEVKTQHHEAIKYFRRLRMNNKFRRVTGMTFVRGNSCVRDLHSRHGVKFHAILGTEKSIKADQYAWSQMLMPGSDRRADTPSGLLFAKQELMKYVMFNRETAFDEIIKRNEAMCSFTGLVPEKYDIVAITTPPVPKSSFSTFVSQLPRGKVIVLIDGMQIPDNLIMLLNTCRWKQVAAVAYTEQGMDPYDARITDGCRGIQWEVPIFKVSVEDVLHVSKEHGFRLVVLSGAPQAQNLVKPLGSARLIPMPGLENARGAFAVFGNETGGVSAGIVEESIRAPLRFASCVTREFNSSVVSGVLIQSCFDALNKDARSDAVNSSPRLNPSG